MGWWNDIPWRNIQVNMNESDYPDLDAEEYVRQLQSFGATVVLMNVGGIIAGYKTEVEDHVICPTLFRDDVGQLIDACHKAGIRVLARLDVSKADVSVYNKHPDWAYRMKDGSIINYYGLVHMCPCGGYQQQKAPEIMREVLERFPVDGVFFNMGGFRNFDYSYNRYSLCHCQNCQRRFREMFGMDLPDKEDMNDPAYRKYLLFQKRVVYESEKKMADLIKSIRPDICIDDIDFVRLESNTEIGRKGQHWVYNSSSNARMPGSIRKGKTVSNAHVDYMGFWYRQVAVSAPMAAMREWQDIGNFVGLDYFIIGRLDKKKDRSNYAPVKKAFAFMAKHDEILHGLHSAGDVLVLWKWKEDRGLETQGWISALTQAHIPFEEADIRYLNDIEQLRRFQTVIVPDIVFVDDVKAGILDEYVKQGGNLVAVSGTGRYDGEGDEREGSAFASLGINKIRFYREDMRSSLYEIPEADKALFPSFPNTDVIASTDRYVYADYAEDVEKHLWLVPPHRVGPPEKCYYTEVTREPGFTVHRYGEGRGVFIPWNPGEFYYMEGYENPFFFMKDVLTQVLGHKPCAAPDVTPMVEITRGYDENKTRAMIGVINESGFFGRHFFEPVELYDLKIRMPLVKEPTLVKDIETGEEIPFTWEDGCVCFSANVKELTMYAVSF